MNKVIKATSIFIYLCIGASFASNAQTEPTQLQMQQMKSLGAASTSVLLNSEQSTYFKPRRNGLLLPGEVAIEELLPVGEANMPPPYGANLFAGGYESERSDGLNEDYTIAAGDKVSVQLWGAINQNELLTVDNQGNLFITNVGPIHVGNIKASQLNAVVTEKIKQVYKSNVQIYVNLLNATPIAVYITGSVIRPGQYSGLPSDSLLYFLKRAGGIDSDRGSYRSIKELRNNKLLETVDLYNFMLNGYMPNINFKDSDVILIDKQSATVSVSGSVRSPFRFEFPNNNPTGAELVTFARPYSKVSHVGIVGDRNEGPFSVYLTAKEFNLFELEDGDKIFFSDDIRAQIIDVQISGSYLGPSYFAVKKDTRLHDLLAHVEIDKALADNKSIYIQRESVAIKQKEMIDQSLDSLERSVFTAPANSDGEASIRAAEAQMVLQFTERARKIKPLGKVILSDNGKVANIQLEQGDIIVIPVISDLIHIGGEVLMPQAVVYNKSAVMDDYIAWAGGYTERSNYERIMVIHPNGSVEVNSTGQLKPGDQILVLPKVDAKIMQAVKDITQIIYQIAIAADVATR